MLAVLKKVSVKDCYVDENFSTEGSIFKPATFGLLFLDTWIKFLLLEFK